MLASHPPEIGYMFAAKLLTHTRVSPFVALVLSLAACAACAAAPEAPSAAAAAPIGSDLPAGWTRVVIADENFSIGVPKGWDELSSEDLGESGVFGELASANPVVADTLSQAEAAIASGQMAFFAFDGEPQSTAAEFAANVNVINAGPTGGSAADAAAEMAEAIRAELPINGEVETETTSIPAGDAAIVRYEWTIAGANGASTDVSVTQYAVLADGNGYVITFSAPIETMAEYGPIFEQVAESFETE